MRFGEVKGGRDGGGDVKVGGNERVTLVSPWLTTRTEENGGT